MRSMALMFISHLLSTAPLYCTNRQQTTVYSSHITTKNKSEFRGNTNLKPAVRDNLFHRTQRELSWCFSLLGLSLSSNGLHGFAYSLLVSKELHWLHWLQVFVELIKDRDPCWQVQLHDVFIWHSYKKNRQNVILYRITAIADRVIDYRVLPSSLYNHILFCFVFFL